MKQLFIILVLLFTTIHLSAQNWLTDYKEALKTAKIKGLPVVLVFQGSDWCAPCIKLKHEIWESNEFIKYAKEHYVLLLADFPKKKKNKLTEIQQEKNNQLAERYNKNGYFPLVVVLDERGNVLGETGYKKVSPSAYIKEINSFILN